jgi:membrane-associated protease RseP (regulator of RpoE activity)
MGAEADPYVMLPVRRAASALLAAGIALHGVRAGDSADARMGHFVMTLIYRVRSTLPYFIPLPISPIGTMGAVIGMDGASADRKQIFDIGLAGPLAGLIVAIPICWIGAGQLDLTPDAAAEHKLRLPLAMRLMVDHLQPGAYNHQLGIPFAQLNAYFMAGWVGMLVTGLNMVPVSQLDGGHVTYALFGRWATGSPRVHAGSVRLYGSDVLFLRDPADVDAHGRAGAADRHRSPAHARRRRHTRLVPRIAGHRVAGDPRVLLRAESVLGCSRRIATKTRKGAKKKNRGLLGCRGCEADEFIAASVLNTTNPKRLACCASHEQAHPDRTLSNNHSITALWLQP